MIEMKVTTFQKQHTGLNKRSIGAMRVDKLTRTDTFVHKTKWSRCCYAFALLSIVLFWPFWLKCITLKYSVRFLFIPDPPKV